MNQISSTEKKTMDTTVKKKSAPSLRTNFSWTFLGHLIYTGCQWGMLVVLAKLGSSEMVGLYTIGLAVTAPVMQFASLRMGLAQATDANHDYEFGDYLGLRLISNFLAVLVILGIVLFTDYNSETASIIIVVGLVKFIQGITDVFIGLYQQNERMDRMAFSLILKGLLSLTALSLGLYFTDSLFWAVICMAAAWALTLLIYDLPNGKMILQTLKRTFEQTNQNIKHSFSLLPRWELKTLVKLGWLLLPLGFVVMLSSLQTNIPRYFVERNLGVAELGIFAAIASFDRAGNLIVKALAQSTSPRLSQYYSAGRKSAFRNLLMKTAGMGVLLGIAGVLVVVVAGGQILTLFFQPEYARNDIFIFIMIAAGLNYTSTFLIYGVTAARSFPIQVAIYTLTSITLVGACFVLVPSLGLKGAAISLILSRFVQLVGSLVTAGKELRNFKPQEFVTTQ